MELYELTVHELLEKLDSKEITLEDITKSYKDRIDDKEKDVQAFVTVTYDEALELLNPQITNNMSVIITETNPSGDNYKEEFYRKDKVSYEKFSNGDNALHEILYNLETLEQNNKETIEHLIMYFNQK